MLFSVIADLLCVAVAVVIIVLCTKKGIISMIINAFKYIASLLIAYLFCTKLTAFFVNLFVGPWMRSLVYQKIDELVARLGQSVNVDEIANCFPSFMMTETMKAEIESAKTGAGGEIEAVKNAVTDAIAVPLADVVATIIAFIVLFLLTLIVLAILAKLIDKLSDQVVLLGFINHFLGFLVGCVLAFVLILTVASVIGKYCAGQEFYAKSFVLKWFGSSALFDLLRLLNLGEHFFIKYLK